MWNLGWLGKALGRILGPAQKGWLKQGCPGKTVDGGLQFVMLVVDEFTVLLLIWKPVSSLQAAMWGAYYGLDLAWNLGFLKLEIKADSTDLAASLHIGGAVLVDPISS